ncbi:MAG: GNAT family N-acetyltransferase [Flavobacteriales bacterium]|nr:GNAT family N-acetyltransferase [Flavobacteriales bacterium]
MDYFNLQSERLQFRKLSREDIPKWTTFFNAKGNDSLPYLGIDMSKSAEEIATEWIELQFPRYENVGLGHLAIELKSTGEFIGVSGIIPREIKEQDRFEIAYTLHPDFWGNGYGSEAAQRLKEFGKNQLKIKKFISIIHINNERSINVARKNGMEVLFHLENFKGMPVDVYGD